ncbi:MAG: hypothetical protein KC486_14080 [Myxococcales bacterium]|nr:hypothetical protein [Myxococcales bacterium]
MHAPLVRAFLFSLVIYVQTFLLTTMLHELAHALTSLALGGRPVLHHVYVAHEGIDGARRAMVSAAGPLMSLAQGLALLAVFRRRPGPATAGRLALLWLCIHGLVNFFGYLVTTPFVPNADLGKVAAWLELPGLARWGIFAAGIAAITWIGLWAREPLLRFVVEPATRREPAARVRHIAAIGVAPWLVGGAVIAAASWPSPHWISYVYPFFAGFFLIVTIRRARSVTPPEVPGAPWVEAALWPWVVGLAAVVGLLRAVVGGVALGG